MVGLADNDSGMPHDQLANHVGQQPRGADANKNEQPPLAALMPSIFGYVRVPMFGGSVERKKSFFTKQWRVKS